MELYGAPLANFSMNKFLWNFPVRKTDLLFTDLLCSLQQCKQKVEPYSTRVL
jgi:hypothetical protein